MRIEWSSGARRLKPPMLSYVYMRILESRPRRYDTGIRLLSFGRSETCKRRIVADTITPGVRMLEIGVGTGTLALLAAEKGASVLGFDVSAAMLDVAREKAESTGMANRVELRQMGVGQMDGLPAGSFDLVVATLVFSELSSDERVYALHEAFRVLNPEGTLVVADETKPRGLLRRVAYELARIPPAILAFVVTQTTTRTVEGLEELVRDAGFRITDVERSPWGAFLYLTAVKGVEV